MSELNRSSRSRPAPLSLGWRHWRTFSCLIIIVSLIGNVCILVAGILRLCGVIDHL